MSMKQRLNDRGVKLTISLKVEQSEDDGTNPHFLWAEVPEDRFPVSIAILDKDGNVIEREGIGDEDA